MFPETRYFSADVVHGREYFYQTDDDLHVNDIVLVPVDYKYQTGALKAAVDDKEIADILAKLNLTDTDLDDLIDILPDSDFKF